MSRSRHQGNLSQRYDSQKCRNFWVVHSLNYPRFGLWFGVRQWYPRWCQVPRVQKQTVEILQHRCCFYYRILQIRWCRVRSCDDSQSISFSIQFKTLPIKGPFRFQVGEPFYYYDVRAEISHNGQFKEVVLVDENTELKNVRPFLFLIWAMICQIAKI